MRVHVHKNEPNVMPVPARRTPGVTPAAPARVAPAPGHERLDGEVFVFYIVASAIAAFIALAAVLVNTQEFHLPAVSASLPMIFKVTLLALWLLVSSLSFAYLLSWRGLHMATFYCSIWDGSRLLSLLAATSGCAVTVMSMMLFNSGDDFVQPAQVSKQAAVRLLPAPPTAPAVSRGEEQVFRATGQYANDLNVLRQHLDMRQEPALRRVKTLITLNSGRTWLARLHDNQLISRTHGRHLETSPAGDTQLRRGSS